MSFRFTIETKHHLSPPVTIPCKTSRSWSANSMKQPHHLTRRSLCFSRSGQRQKPRTDLPFLQICFSKFAWSLPYRLQDVQEVTEWLIASPASKWRVCSPRSHWTARQLAGLDENLTSRKRANSRNICERLSVITVHGFLCLVEIPLQFSPIPNKISTR